MTGTVRKPAVCIESESQRLKGFATSPCRTYPRAFSAYNAERMPTVILENKAGQESNPVNKGGTAEAQTFVLCIVCRCRG